MIERINLLTAMVREQSGKVIWIRHCGKTGDGFERHTEGWSFLPELNCHRDDIVIEKTLNDPFVGTSLQETLERIAPDRILVAGWLVYTNVRQTGPLITITFKDGNGLQANQTIIKYQGIRVGEVRSVQLTKDLQQVVVQARLQRFAAALASRPRPAPPRSACARTAS